MSVHPSAPSHPVVPAITQPGIPRTTHESVPHLRVHGDAQAERHPAATTFDATRHICIEDVLLAPPGIFLIVRWAKAIQVVGRTTLLPLTEVLHYLADSVAAYRDMLVASPKNQHNTLLLTFKTRTGTTTVTFSPVYVLCNYLVYLLHVVLLTTSLLFHLLLSYFMYLYNYC